MDPAAADTAEMEATRFDRQFLLLPQAIFLVRARFTIISVDIARIRSISSRMR